MTNLYLVEGDSFSIGRSLCNDIALPECDVISTKHITVSKGNCSDILLMNGQNGGYISNRFLWKNESRTIEYGDEIRVAGITIIWLHDYALVKSDSVYRTKLKVFMHGNCDDVSDKKMFEYFRPSPRSIYGIDDTPVELEAPPEKQSEEVQGKLMAIGPAFTMAIPMVLGMIISMTLGKSKGSGSESFMVAGIITAVSSALLGVIWGGLNLNARTRRIIENEKKRRQIYENYVNQCEVIIRDKYYRNRNTLRLMNPCIREKFTEGNEKIYIFNNDPLLKDSFKVRLGTGKDFFNVNITVPKGRISVIADDLKDVPNRLKKKYEYQDEVPICINLLENSPVGFICNNANNRNEILRGVLLSIAASLKPTDIKIASLINNSTNNPFKNIAYKLLPHIWENNTCLIAENHDEIGAIAEELTRFSGYKLIFTDCYSVVNKVINSEKTIYIVISDSFVNLPDICRAVLQSDEQYSGVIFLSDGATYRKNIYFDTIGEEECLKYIRRLSRLSTGLEASNKEMPDKVSFLEMIDKSPPSPTEIVGYWNNSSTIDDISIPIGINGDGETLFIDFHEKKHGPHGLVGGMTGSGKSEVLQTFILSLSLKYHPYEVGFFLIDYKGGGMASLFDGLPHIMGSISNLSGDLIQRAMVSIRGENERRQMLFNENHVNNIYDYTALFKSGKTKAFLPHIFIIIDEFAELKCEEPEFMKELISVARVGRSLGIHLILATQKPAGTVDENIWSNSRFRICLRVQDKQDSNEMLHKPDAADIINPGRAYLQVGNDEVFMQFQSAYTRATLRKSGYRKRTVVYVGCDETEIIETDYEENQISELQVLISNIAKAGEISGINNIRGLWQPPLENRLFYEDSGDENSISIGVYDNPRKQSKGVYNIKILGNGHIFINGSIASGKSTLLMTISYALIKKYSPKEINLYVVDFSSCKLIPFATSKICGGFYYEENEANIEKLMFFIKDEVIKRKAILQGIDFMQYRKHSDGLPLFVLIIDGFGVFREKTAGEFDDIVLDLLKNGERLGITAICSANGISTGEMPTRLFEHFKTSIGLDICDKYKYGETLRLPSDKIISHGFIPGRGVVRHGDEALLFQAYMPVRADDDYELLKVIKDDIEVINEKYVEGITAIPVPEVPSDLSIDVLMKKWNGYNVSDKGDNILPVGYEKRTGKIFGLNLDISKVIIVSGGKGSGKTNFIYVVKEISEMIGINAVYEYNEPFEHLSINTDKTRIKIIVCPYDATSIEKEKIKAECKDGPLVIHFGGCLDRQDFSDFSFVSYLEKQRPKETGIATVCGDGYIKGDVVIVRGNNSDTC
ncbi:MAG: FtsK/SpoIIIE domain-containing protein [Lachnospiraceae bacterium]|nr:FtsK/SpoIIIE domain-containing protein [Lachnospiraceae bacterium]